MLYQASVLYFQKEIHTRALGNMVLSWPDPCQGGTALQPYIHICFAALISKKADNSECFWITPQGPHKD